MAARPAVPTRATEARRSGPGGLHHWPQFVVRCLFGTPNETDEPQPRPIPVARFQNLCVSREAGAGGGALARLVGQRMGWKVYDEELVEAIAYRMQVPIDEVRALDELAPSVVQDWLLPLREEYYAPQEAYLDHLAKLIEAIGRAGESILVGRGAGFMLPRETTLTIRVIAPLRDRASRLAERMGVSVRTARRAARDLDRRRAQFDRTMHRANVNDPHHFDLVLDTHSLGLEIAAEVVIQTIEIGRTVAPAQDAGSQSLPESAYSKPESTGIPAGSPDDLDRPPAAARVDIPHGASAADSGENRHWPAALSPPD
jgi:cytidylate kinase